MNYLQPWTLVPGISIGPFRLSRPVQDEAMRYTDVSRYDEEALSLRVNGVHLCDFTIENELVEHATCFHSCVLLGRELIGMSRAELLRRYREPGAIEIQPLYDHSVVILTYDEFMIDVVVSHDFVSTVDVYSEDLYHG